MEKKQLLKTAALALIACTAISVLYLVAPAYGSFRTTLLGSAPFPYDAMLNAGVLEWGFRSLLEGGRSVFEWNAGFPVHNALAGTENLLGWQVFYSPLRLIGLGVPASYNIVLVASIVLSGVGAAVLTRKLGAGIGGALLSAIAFAFNPFHINHAIHLQTMAICWAPFALLALELYLETGRSRYAVWFGAATLIALLSGLYVGVMLMLMSVCYVMLSLRRISSSRRKSLTGFAIALFGVVIASLPVTWHLVQFAQANGWYQQKAETLTRFSLNIGAFLRAPAWLGATQHTPLAAKGLDTQTPAFPGFVVLVLAAIAVVSRKNVSSAKRTLVGMTLISAVLALGPFLKLRTEGIIESLRWLPMPGKLWLVVPGVRWPMRVYLFASLTLAVLAGLGLSRLSVSSRQRSIVAAVAIALLLFEVRPGSLYSTEAIQVREPLAMSDAYPFIASERDTGAVVEIPARDSRKYATPMLTRYVYGSAGHLRRVVAFHGNFVPAKLQQLRAEIDSLPSTESIAALKSSGVTRLVVHRDLLSSGDSERFAGELSAAGLTKVFDRGHSVVFSLAQTR